MDGIGGPVAWITLHITEPGQSMFHLLNLASPASVHVMVRRLGRHAKAYQDRATESISGGLGCAMCNTLASASEYTSERFGNNQKQARPKQLESTSRSVALTPQIARRMGQ